MPRRCLVCTLPSVLVLFVATRASAIPPPKTEQELMEMSDLVVDATCVSVECEGPPVEYDDRIVTTYLSTLQPFHTYKGQAPETVVMRVETTEAKMDVQDVGGWIYMVVPEGFVGKFYLSKLDDGTYRQVWWNGIEEDVAATDEEPLPECDDQGGDAGPNSGDGSLRKSSSEGCGCSQTEIPPSVPLFSLVILLALAVLVRTRR